MTKECCGDKAAAPCAGSALPSGDPAVWFGAMIDHCYQHALAEKKNGKPIVGILCEFTPRELIMAAGGVPICLCGGSAKTIPAAEEFLPANLCPLIKSTFGYAVQKTNPFLEMADLIVGETTCDGKKKMYELLAETRDVYILELPQKGNDPDAFDHWRRELKKFRDFLQKRYGSRITDAKLRKAIEIMNRERALRRDLASLMRSKNPPMTGRQLLQMKSSISGIPADFEQYEKAIALFGKKKTSREGVPPVRVLMTGVPMVHGAERVLDIIEDGGGLVVAMENCTGLKPILEDVDAEASDPLLAIAEKYFHLPCSVTTPNDRRMDTLKQLVKQYKPDCVVELIWQACLTYDVEAHRVRRMVENQLKLPYLRIETDYSPSDSARIGVRVEAMFETVRNQPKK